MSYGELVDLARKQRSVPVFPVPVWYVLAGLVGWAAAEWAAVRAARRTGLLAGAVLVYYGLIRLVFDGLLNESWRKLGLTGSQWIAIVIAVFGLVLCVMPRRFRSGLGGRP
jgi:prolipoprotein diacylglyceryltransferase